MSFIREANSSLAATSSRRARSSSAYNRATIVSRSPVMPITGPVQVYILPHYWLIAKHLWDRAGHLAVVIRLLPYDTASEGRCREDKCQNIAASRRFGLGTQPGIYRVPPATPRCL